MVLRFTPFNRAQKPHFVLKTCPNAGADHQTNLPGPLSHEPSMVFYLLLNGSCKKAAWQSSL